MPKVLVTARSFRQTRGEHWLPLQTAGYDIDVPSEDRPLQAAELKPLVAEVEAILVGMDEVTAEVIAAARRLRVIAKFGVGIDNIDVAAATRAGVAVTITPGANKEAVAELALGLMLALLRRLPYHDAQVRRGDWSRQTGSELQGKTVGIIGMGQIGKEVATRLEAFRVNLLAYDLLQDEEFASQHGVHYTSLDSLLTESDVVTLHSSLSPASQNLIGERELGLMKPSACLINTARGGLVDERALARALSESRLSGAALDVFSAEPPRESPLLSLGNKVVLTPHIGANTTEAIVRMGRIAAESIVAVLSGERPPGLVNPETVSRPA